MTGFICGPKVYKFEGQEFEVHSFCGPSPLDKNGDPEEEPSSEFYEMYDRFNSLSDLEKEKFRIGGGCIPLK